MPRGLIIPGCLLAVLAMLAITASDFGAMHPSFPPQTARDAVICQVKEYPPGPFIVGHATIARSQAGCAAGQTRRVRIVEEEMYPGYPVLLVTTMNYDYAVSEGYLRSHSS